MLQGFATCTIHLDRSNECSPSRNKSDPASCSQECSPALLTFTTSQFFAPFLPSRVIIIAPSQYVIRLDKGANRKSCAKPPHSQSWGTFVYSAGANGRYEGTDFNKGQSTSLRDLDNVMYIVKVKHVAASGAVNSHASTRDPFHRICTHFRVLRNFY
jgi:hypothetical protein